MSGKPGQKSEKATEIAEHYDVDFLESMDGRVRTVRTLRQRLGQLTADLAGFDSLSYMERSLCRRIIHLERLLERREMTLSHGGSIDDQAYFSGITTLSSLYTKLGLKRRAKVIGTSAEQLTRELARQNGGT